MKRLICFTICIIFMTSTIYLSILPVYGNSAPSYWEGFPYSEVLTVEADSSITVDREQLTFDFSKAVDYEDRNARSPVGRVAADYQMSNPTDDTLTVQMAFPFVTNIYSLSVPDILVSDNGAAVPYEIYIDSNTIKYRDDAKGEFVYDYGTIGDITKQEATLPGFDLDSEASLYRFTASSKEKPYLDFEISFDLDQKQTFLIGSDFNGGAGYSEIEGGTLSSRIREMIEPEILVMGKSPEFRYEVLTEEGEKADESVYQLEIVQDSVDPREYLLNKLRKEIGEDTAAAISDTQLYNLMLQSIWQYRLMDGYSTLFEAFSGLYEDRIFTLVYQVTFPPKSTRNIRVGYLMEGAMDRRETLSPKYSYTYLLSPAKNWADFGTLEVDIITPREAPYIIESSLALAKDGKNRYRGKCEGLPESELTFTLYEKNEVTYMDRVENAAAKSSYLLFFFWPITLIVLGVFMITITGKIIQRKRSL